MGGLKFRLDAQLYFDTSPLIYSVEEHPTYWQQLQGIWDLSDNEKLSIATSELSLLETLVVPLRDENIDLVNAYETLLTGFKVGLLPITPSVLRSAGHLRAKLNLKTPDPIHAATALLAGCSHFVTNDASSRRLTDIEVIVLSDFL